MNSGEVLEGEVYDFGELELVDKGLAPLGFEEEVSIIEAGAENSSQSWDITQLISSNGVVI